LEKVIEKFQYENLPARIREIYAFGGILRGKERPRDFDAVFLYEQSPDQKRRWDTFVFNFGDIGEDKKIRQKLQELFRPYYEQEIPLREVIRNPSVSKVLRELGIEPEWAGCFSWSDLYHSPIGIFVPDISKVLRSLLIGKMKGLQAIFREYNQFKEGKTLLIAKNFKLAWRPDKPDIRKNLEMSPEEKLEYAKSELQFFNEQLTNLKTEFAKLQAEIEDLAQKNKIKLFFDKLLSKTYL
jgi:hypothetical protein